MAQEPWQPLLDLTSGVRAAWPAGGWSWDHRFKCAVSTLEETAKIPQARQALAALLTQQWDVQTLSSAPDDVRALVQAKGGGMRPGQWLFCSDPVQGMRLYGLWWPWNGDANVSLRLGIDGSDRPKELFPLIRTALGIA